MLCCAVYLPVHIRQAMTLNRSWADAPGELLEAIFLKLDNDSKLNAERVCRAWHTVLEQAQVPATSIALQAGTRLADTYLLCPTSADRRPQYTALHICRLLSRGKRRTH